MVKNKIDAIMGEPRRGRRALVTTAGAAAPTAAGSIPDRALQYWRGQQTSG